MSITLSPETERLLDEKLRGGEYRSADDVVRAALEALDAQRPAALLDDQTLDAIDRGEQDIDEGKVHDWKDVRVDVRAKFLRH